MEETKTTGQATDSEVSNARALHGKNPPVSPLKTVIKYLDALMGSGGAKGTFDDLTKAVDSTSINSSTFYNRSALLKNFGVINVDRKNHTYKIEPLGVMISAGKGAEQRKEAIKKAFLNIPTIKKIWNEYKGNILPSRESLPNNLAATLPDDVPEPLKEAWAKYFYDGAEFAGFLEKRANGNYLLFNEPKPEEAAKGENNGESGGGVPAGSELAKPPSNNPQQTIFVSPSDTLNFSKVLSTDRMLTITVPEDPTPDEANEIVARAKMLIKSMKGFMETEE